MVLSKSAYAKHMRANDEDLVVAIVKKIELALRIYDPSGPDGIWEVTVTDLVPDRVIDAVMKLYDRAGWDVDLESKKDSWVISLK